MRALPPVAVAVSFVDCINRGDVHALSRLMTEDHTLHVFDEPPVVGRTENSEAWRGYVDSFPQYVIYPRRIADDGAGKVAILGHTTGSHLGLPDDEESRLTLIWLVDIADGGVRSWSLIDDTPDNRREVGLDDGAAELRTSAA